MHFTKLSFIWSMGPTATSEIFVDLKHKQPDPDKEYCKKVGVENAETLECEFNPTPQEVLRSMPGITSQNYRTVMLSGGSLRKLCAMELVDLQHLMGELNGAKFYDFVRKDLRMAT